MEFLLHWQQNIFLNFVNVMRKYKSFYL